MPQAQPTFQLHVPQWRLAALGSAMLTDWHATGVFVPCWRLYWCAAPECAWIRGRLTRRYWLSPDCFTMIAPNTYVVAGLERPVHHMWFHFDAGPPYDRATNWIGQLQLTGPQRRDAEDLAAILEDKGLQQASHPAGVCISEILSRGMRCVPDELLKEGTVDSRLTEALQIARADLRHTPSSLARRLDVGATTLNRIFQTGLGLSPGRVLGLLRVERARELLSNTRNDISTIAEICGYCDRHHFTRRFTEAYGMGPAAYREHA